MTILRGILVAGLSGFLFLPRPEGWLAWLPAILYTLSDATDFFDGYLARRSGRVTQLGEILDLRLDGSGVMVAAMLAVKYGQVPAWYLAVALARYLFVCGLWLRQRMHLPVYELPPSVSRRVFAALQMSFLAVALWPVFSPPATYVAAAVFGLPFLVGFVRDWFYVSGVFKPYRPGENPWLEKITNWMPLVFRLAVLAVNLGLIIQHLPLLHTFSALEQAFLALEILAAALVVAGIAGRTAACAGMLLAGFLSISGSTAMSFTILLPVYAGILFMGSGLYSLWKPEDALVYRRVGERAAVRVERGG